MIAAVTIELEGKTLSLLDELATRLARPRAAIVQQALEEWLAAEAEDIAQIEAGTEADAGLFASDDEVAAVFARYGVAYDAGR
jgi:predicted transcriptional regulator